MTTEPTSGATSPDAAPPDAASPRAASQRAASPDAAADGGLLRFVRDSAPGTLIERLGIEFVEVSAHRLVATMPVAGNTQPYGLLHGGASVALAETLGSFGAMLHGRPDRVAVGVDINATHHRAARSGLVTGTATALSLGGTVASYEVVVTDEDDRRVCTARLTCLLRPAPPGR